MGIKFFEKNYLDLDNTDASITVTDSTASNDGSSAIDFVRDRKNTSGHQTVGSDDAANTQYDIDLGEPRDINRILLLNHNFEAYTIQYKSGASYVDFSTAISVSANTAASTYHEFNSVAAQEIRIIVTACQTTDADKTISQIIVTTEIGEFSSIEPNVSGMIADQRRSADTYVSGKRNVVRAVGGLSLKMEKANVTDSAALDLQRELFQIFDGFLVYLSGGDASQFDNDVDGWRLQDIYLMMPVNERPLEFEDGRFKHGNRIRLDLVEVN